jgi:uridylate kinase
MSTKPYTRLLLKISGEQLAGEYEFGVDPKIADFLAKEIKKVTETGCRVVVVVGGGNMVRGSEVAGHGIRRVTADQMGMLSGLINSMCLTDVFEANDMVTRCLSSLYAEQVAESYSYRRAEKHLQSGRVVVVAGGIARPYFTHDTAAVSYALELDCQLVLKATNVEGVYDKDPNKYADAVKIDNISFQEAVSNELIKVMDKAALGLALEHEVPIVVFNPMIESNFYKASIGEPIGTMIS